MYKLTSLIVCASLAHSTAVFAETAAAGTAKQTVESRQSLESLETEFQTMRAEITADVLESFSDQIDIYETRAYQKEGADFPWQLKCTSVDYRTFHACPELRFFDPSARVYFDVGSDDENELDLFNDGKLNVSVDLVSLYLPWRLGKSAAFDQWSWGPVVGAGLGATASTSRENEVSGAPVVLFSAGGMLQYKLDAGPSFSFEAGWSQGFSSDESLDDAHDTAAYVGIRIHVPLGKRESPVTRKKDSGP